MNDADLATQRVPPRQWRRARRGTRSSWRCARRFCPARFVGTPRAALADALADFLVTAGGAADRLGSAPSIAAPASAHRSGGAARRVGSRHRRDRRHAVGAARRDPAPPAAAQAGRQLARAVPGWSTASSLARGSRSRCLTSAGPRSAAISNAPSSSIRAICSARSTKRSSARPAASPTACWSSTTTCATAPSAGSAPTMSTRWPSLSGVAAAAFSPIILGASPALLEVDISPI